MKSVAGRIVKGAVVTRARLPEGARVRIVVEDDRPPAELDDDEEAGMRQGIDEIERGLGLPVAKLRAKLRRSR